MLKQDIINYLDMHGTNAFTVFPDIQGFKAFIDNFLIPPTVR